MAFKKSYKKKGTKKRTYKKRVHKKTKGSFVKKVMKVVRSKEQVKYAVVTGDMSIGNYQSLTPNLAQIYAGVNPTSLPIVQGTGAGDRLGDKIKIKKITLRMILFPNPTTAISNNPATLQEVRILVGHNRLTPTAALPVATMFEDGDTALPPQQNLTDMMAPINRHVIVPFKEKVIKLGSSGMGVVGTTGAAAGNNDFKMNHRFTWDITKASPSTIIYQGATAASQQSMVPYLMAWSTPADNSSQAFQGYAVQGNYTIVVEYTDF